MDQRVYRGIRWAALGASVALCLLAYGRVLPIAAGMAGAVVIPLVWTVDAYRAESRLRFALSAALVLITALPLLRLVR